jgi:hypothetical protein
MQRFKMLWLLALWSDQDSPHNRFGNHRPTFLYTYFREFIRLLKNALKNPLYAHFDPRSGTKHAVLEVFRV